MKTLFAVAALAGPLWLRSLGAAAALVALATAAYAMSATGRAPWGGFLAPLGALVFGFAAVRGTLPATCIAILSWLIFVFVSHRVSEKYCLVK